MEVKYAAGLLRQSNLNFRVIDGRPEYLRFSSHKTVIRAWHEFLAYMAEKGATKSTSFSDTAGYTLVLARHYMSIATVIQCLQDYSKHRVGGQRLKLYYELLSVFLPLAFNKLTWSITAFVQDWCHVDITVFSLSLLKPAVVFIDGFWREPTNKVYSPSLDRRLRRCFMKWMRKSKPWMQRRARTIGFHHEFSGTPHRGNGRGRPVSKSSQNLHLFWPQ